MLSILRAYNVHKLDPRSIPSLFLCSSNQHKGYKCLSSSGRMFISRHVLFNETKFPTAQFLFPFQPDVTTHKVVSFLPIIDGLSPMGNIQPNTTNSSINVSIVQPAFCPFPSAQNNTDLSHPSLSSVATDQTHHSSNSISQTTISPTNNISSPNTLPSVSNTSAPIPTTILSSNTHFKVTRGKNGVFKPKIFLTEYKEIEPPNVKETLKCSHWVQAM